MQTLSFPHYVPVDHSIDRPLRVFLAALAMLAAAALFVPTEAVPTLEHADPPVTVRLAGGVLGAQALEAAPDDLPMICLACSTIV